MATKPGLSDAERIRAFHDKLDGPLRPVIIGATAYWLEDAAGAVLTAEAPTSDVPLLDVLTMVAAGANPKDLRLVCSGPRLRRFVISEGGVLLIDMAEGAAGIPARPRGPMRERLGKL